MSSVAEEKQIRRGSRPSREILVAAGAVGAIAIVLCQPAVMSVSGLDFKARRAAGQEVDSLTVSSIDRDRHVHGLSGILKTMRMRD
jgi:hypothetical protein